MNGAAADPGFPMNHTAARNEEDLVKETSGAAPHTAIGELCRHAVVLIGAAGPGIRRVRLRAGDSAVELEWPAVTAAPPEVTAAAPAAGHAAGAGEAAAGAEAGHQVLAPVVGTFYWAPEPGAPPFVTVGDTVEKGQQVGIVEAMKLMNPVEADRSGRVTAILVPDGSPVEYGQPLVAIDPFDVS